MGILESWATYWWNWVTFLDGYQTLMICWLVGGWGLFFSDDNGVLANRCYRMAGGTAIAFPVEYKSIYGEYSDDEDEEEDDD